VQFFHREAMRNIPGVLGVWPLSEAAGEAEDYGTGHNGVPSGGLVRAQPSLLPNREGRSCLFNGTNSFFTITAAPIINLADVVSLSAWVKPIVVGSERVIFTLGINAISLAIQGNAGKLLASKTGVAGFVFSNIPTPNETPVFVVMTKNGAERHCYINGVDISQLVANQTLEASEENKLIGKYSGGLFYSGYLQYLGLYSTALTPAQVTTLWGSAHQGLIRPTPIDTQVKALYG
jgi:energy-converting hydrogenase Eha subunit B